MSATTMNASDLARTSAASGSNPSKQQTKSNGGTKALDNARKQAASPSEGQNSKRQQMTQPKAWQGPNPITHRAYAQAANGLDKPLPKTPSEASMNPTGDSQADKHAHERALFLLANFTGLDATLTLKNGEQFVGVFSGGSFEPNSKHQYVLKMVKRTRLPTHQQINGHTELPEEYVGDGEDHVVMFDKDDTVDLAVKDVVTTSAKFMQNGQSLKESDFMEFRLMSVLKGSTTSSFRTDTEISGRGSGGLRERELQRWDSSGDIGIGMSLEDSGGRPWDQFAVNKQWFNVTSTYREEEYTTPLDRDSASYQEREAEAERIAREIEGSTSTDRHVTEERRRDAAQGDELDEEDRYSGVQRQPSALPKRAHGAYVPPPHRPIVATPSVPGAPFDPAIISSQLARPAPPVGQHNAVEATPAVHPEATDEEQTSAPKESTDVSNLATAAQASKKPSENTTEDHVRNVTDAFKQFATHEKIRTRAAQEAKRDTARATARAEKNVKLNDLKAFAANFKLKSRVPLDLVPILAKDSKKQQEIQQRAEEAAKEEAMRAKDKEKEKTPNGPASVAASPAASQPGNAPVEQRSPFAHQQQSSRSRITQNLRDGLPINPSPRQPIGPHSQSSAGRAYNRAIPALQTLPVNMRLPNHGPVVPAESGPGALPQGSATRLNGRAFEFRPAANTFTPLGTETSPQRKAASSTDRSVPPQAANFFENKKESEEKKDIDDAFNPVKRMLEAEYTEEQKKSYASNGGIPQPYRTPPTWPVSDANINASYKDFFTKPRMLTQGPSPMHTPSPSVHGAHSYQLPPHLQGSNMGTPSQRTPYLPPPQHPGQHPSTYDPRMQHFGTNGSVQSSPRYTHAQMAYGGQTQGMPVPPYGGHQMPGYAVSPSMQYRQVQMPPPQGQMMMMSNHQPGQMPPMPQGYGSRNPQYASPNMMSGGPQQSSAYMNGPLGSPYSPMPPQAQPHMQHHGGYGGGGGGYGGGNARPHMMQQSASHQGYGPNMLPSPYAQHSANQPHPYHMQHQPRQYSNHGYHPHMTPRQHGAVPMHMSPGMGVPGQGDEGK